MKNEIMFLRDIVGIDYNPKLRYRIGQSGTLYANAKKDIKKWGSDFKDLYVVLGKIGEDGVSYSLSDLDWLHGYQLFPYVIHKEFDSFVKLFHYYVDLEFFLDSVFADFTWDVCLSGKMVCCKVTPTLYYPYDRAEVLWLDSSDESYCKSLITKTLILWY